MTRKNKLRAVALAAMLLLSTIALSGAASAIKVVDRGGNDDFDHDPGEGKYDPGNATVRIDKDYPVVYKGEGGLTFYNGSTDEKINPARLTGVAGDAEGQVLEMPIPQDQPAGLYTLDGTRDTRGITLTTPRITDVDVMNSRATDISGAEIPEDEVLLVGADWNFPEAEDLEMDVVDSSGTDITQEVYGNYDDLSDDQKKVVRDSGTPFAEYPEELNTPGYGSYLHGWGQFNQTQVNDLSTDNDTMSTAYGVFDFSDLPAGDYTIYVYGWDYLNYGDAMKQISVTVSSDDEVSLELDSDSAAQGEYMGYNVRGSDAGATHYVTIDKSDFRGNVTAKVFRTVGDTNGVGATDDFAYAAVEVDDDTGVGYGEIDTGYLDDSSVDVNLYPADWNVTDIEGDYGGYEDQQSLDVTEGELTIESPGKQYVSGAEVDIAGNATAGLDDVAVYARDEGDWELVELGNDNTISVDSDGSWERENVVLSDASDIFSIPGQYRLGVIDARDAEDKNGDLLASMTTSEFSSGTSTQNAVTVTDGSLFATFTSVINNQVSTDDGTVDVEGTAAGQDNVLVAFVDKRGAVATERVSVDDDNTFEQDDIVLEDKDGSDLSEGGIEAVVLSLGRDDVAGDGELPGQNDNNDVNALEDYVANLTDDSLTQAQVLDRIMSETVDDTASDDLVVEDSFRYSDGSLSIETIVPEEYSDETGVYDIETGETVVVKGRTNAQPDDNTITVEVTDGPSADSLDLADTDSWGQNGTWSVKIPVSSDVEPGTYTIEADDGDNTDIIQFEIVGEGERGAIGQPDTTTEEPDTTTEEPDTTTEEPDTTTEEPTTETTEPTTTDSDGQPGFGVALALVAVLGAALLALRTRIEK